VKTNINKLPKDIVIIFVILIISFSTFSYFDVLEKIVEFSSQYEAYEIDEIISTMIVFTACMLIFSIRRLKEANKSREVALEMNDELKKAINEINTLKGIIPICSYCHKIRDDEGEWERVDSYISKHSDARFSHGICPDCVETAWKESES
jgi:hypothetical protein